MEDLQPSTKKFRFSEPTSDDRMKEISKGYAPKDLSTLNIAYPKSTAMYVWNRNSQMFVRVQVLHTKYLIVE